jgi:hypothetical protein
LPQHRAICTGRKRIRSEARTKEASESDGSGVRWAQVGYFSEIRRKIASEMPQHRAICTGRKRIRSEARTKEASESDGSGVRWAQVGYFSEIRRKIASEMT